MKIDINVAPASGGQHTATVEIHARREETADTIPDATRAAFAATDADLAEYAAIRDSFVRPSAESSVLSLMSRLTDVLRDLFKAGVGIEARCTGAGEPAALEALRKLGAKVDTNTLNREEYDRAILLIGTREYEGSITATGAWRTRTNMPPGMTVEFRLTMPSVNTWNGKWSGAGKNYTIVRDLAPLDVDRLQETAPIDGRSWEHSFGDGWRARVTARVLADDERETLAESDGFCGYEWMVDSIVRLGRIAIDKVDRVVTTPTEANAAAESTS